MLFAKLVVNGRRSKRNSVRVYGPQHGPKCNNINSAKNEKLENIKS